MEAFLDMVWSDYRKRFSLIASLLLKDQTIDDIGLKLLEQNVSAQELEERLAEVIEYAKVLLKVDVRPQPFVDYVPTLVRNCKRGAFGTAANRLIDHSTIRGQAVHPDTSSEEMMLFSERDYQRVDQDYDANYMKRKVQALQKRKREEVAGGSGEEVRRRPGAPGVGREEQGEAGPSA